ncbi:MAG: xanthine dehydrogenase family protein subunit M [Chloroflexi bacterium]|nr:xanthine dehydrogenase family protein subunit M [Chloroflexota bacterium]
MVTSSFDYHAPTSVADALALLDQHGEDAKLLAGGHSLIPLMKIRLAEPSVLIDLGKIDTLSYINERDGGLAIGAMTTYSEIAASELVQARAPVLADASGQVADNQVRNRGTIGGSLSHADPAGDLPAVILALAAQMTTSSSGGHRTIDADDFFVELLTTALEPNEILSEIVIPALPVGTGTAYAKFANKASHYAVVGVAAVVTVGSDGTCQSARIAVTGAGPKATRATGSESALVGSSLDDAAIQAAASRADEGIDFNEDVHASAEYRAHLTQVYAGRAIRAAVVSAS